MNKTLTSILLCLAAALTLVCACDEEDQQSYMPTWKGFSYAPQPAERGDSVAITALQDKKGHLIYKAKYTWTATYVIPSSQDVDSVVTETHSDVVVYDNEPADPVWKLYVPLRLRSNSIAVSFMGEYHYSASGPQGTDGSTINDPVAQGSLRQRQSSEFIGQSAGSLTVRVKD